MKLCIALLVTSSAMSTSLLAQDADLAAAWKAGGKYFAWQSTLPENKGKPALQIFYTCMGDEAKPAMLMVHGFPTSSFDFRLLAAELKTEYRMCMLDFPGYGFSDKPATGYLYGLKDDAALLWHFVTDIVHTREFTVFSHDRGDSVTLAFLDLYQQSALKPFRITHQYMTNGNVYLPLANLTDFQKRMLDPATAPAAVKAANPGILAVGMGATNYTPALKSDDPEVKALATQFAWANGVQAIPETIKYLNERKQFEVHFLEVLGKSDIPVTVVWGVHDMVSPVRVANYVWESTLRNRAAAATYWLAPCGNHYVQHDQPAAIAGIVRLSVSKPGQTAPLNLTGEACSAVLVGQNPGSK